MSQTPQERNSLKLNLQYLGDRFSKHTLSCDDTQDIAIFGRMLSKLVMRMIQRGGNKELNDINVKNFLCFEFGGISKGSSVAEINITCDPENLSGPWNPNGAFPDPIACAEEAYRVLMEIISGSKAKQNFEYFKLVEQDMEKFGKALADGEEIDFLESKKYVNENVRYTRKRIAKIRAAHDCGAARRVVGTGTILGFKKNGLVFVNSHNYGKFTFKGHPNKVKSIFDGCIGAKVEFVLNAKLNQQGKISEIIKYCYLELAPKNAQNPNGVEFCMQELEKYASYKHGWFDGEGEEINQEAIGKARKFISQTPEFANRYLISPTPEGFVFIEFVHDGWKKCLEFSGREIEAFGHDIGGRFGRFRRVFGNFNLDLIEFISNTRQR